MRRATTALLLFVLVGLVGAASLPASGASQASPPAGYGLVWADEFDRDGAPDPSTWGYEEGFVRNNEAQWYTRDRRENARVERGLLIIEARQERFANPRHDPARPGEGQNRAAAEYTSASLNTLGRRPLLYGRIEVRARLPHGRGVWPAIWTLGENRSTVGWPRCGEIDIMEFVGHTPDRTHATLHWQQDGKHVSSGQTLAVDRPWDAFHTYAVDWTEDAMEFWVDDRRVQRFDVARATQPDGSNPFRRPHYLLLNLALGGSWGREIDDSILPQIYEIDYVRVYQRTK